MTTASLPNAWPEQAQVRLDQIDLFDLAVRRKATYSRKTIDGAHPVLLVRLKACGRVGWGEVSGRLRVFEDAQRWAAVLLGKTLELQPDPFGALGDFRSDEDTRSYEHVRRFIRPIREHVSIRAYRLADRAWMARVAYHSRQQRKLREAFSIAWYDLAGHITGRSVGELLGGLKRTRVPAMPVVHVYESARTVQLVGAWHDLGFTYIKMKLAGRVDRDLETVSAVRRAFPDVRIQADANYGYRRMRDVLRVSDGLAELGTDYLEDPIMASLHEYAKLSRVSRTRIMVDGRAWWPNIRNVAAAGAAHHINHHSNRQGGLDWALRIANTAASAQITSGIGSGGLTGIQCAAFQTLSGIIGLDRPCEAMLQYRAAAFEHRRFEHDPTLIQQPYTLRDGVIELSTEPGLGVTVDETLLHARTLRHACLC